MSGLMLTRECLFVVICGHCYGVAIESILILHKLMLDSNSMATIRTRNTYGGLAQFLHNADSLGFSWRLTQELHTHITCSFPGYLSRRNKPSIMSTNYAALPLCPDLFRP